MFKDALQSQRESIRQDLKKKLEGFQVGIHTIYPEINIVKLITDKEIEDNQLFFENCAKDYRKLGQQLILELAEKFGVEIDKNYPLNTFNQFKRDNKQTGIMKEWKYYLHGIHCGFEHMSTAQNIEVSLICGEEFGDLDPYFFSNFIKSTPVYNPLPVEIMKTTQMGCGLLKKCFHWGSLKR